MDFRHSVCAEDREEEDRSGSQLDSENNVQDNSGPDMAADTMDESDSEDENDDSDIENDDFPYFCYTIDQCCGSVSTGSTCFWASQIRIQ